MSDGDYIADSELEKLFESPDLFLWQFDGPVAVFVNMDRDTYQNSIFCDQRIFAKSNRIVRLENSRLSEYLSGRVSQLSRLNFIFHIAHCGSTLLARALDVKESNIVYREPAVLRQLGAEAASGFFGSSAPADWNQKLEIVLSLLNRSYAKDGPIVIKANVPVNFMVSELFERNPDEKAILLYSSLENYLLAVLKSPNHRSWVASISAEIGPALESVVGITTEQRRSMSIPEAAACLWLVQIAIFQEMVEGCPNVQSLDSEAFYDDPIVTLKNFFEFMGQEVDDDAVRDIANGELFTRYSKDPRHSYDNATRIAQRDAVRDQLAEDIAKARDWVNQHAAQTVLPTTLGKPLVQTDSLLVD